MTTSPAPITEILSDEDGLATLPWILFFNQAFTGDAGSSWSPTFVDLTEVGEPTITGQFYRVSQSLTFFTVTVNAATNTSATAGTTYIDNFPLNFTGDSFCAAVSNNLGGTLGMITASTNRIYVPPWTTVSEPLTIIGMGVAS